MIKKIIYDQTKYNFKDVFQKHFDESLEKLHKKFKFERRFSNMAGGMEEFSLVAETYAKVIRTTVFNKLWISFIHDVIKPYFDGKPIYVQKLPSFRLFPSYHSIQYVKKITDGYNKHLDSEPPYYHPNFETGFWLPLIECDHNNDFYYKDGDWYRRADIRENQILAFSSDVVHGNRVHNESPNTRCSLDFKALALDDYDENTLTDRIILKRGQKFKQKDWYSTKNYYMEM